MEFSGDVVRSSSDMVWEKQEMADNGCFCMDLDSFGANLCPPHVWSVNILRLFKNITPKKGTLAFVTLLPLIFWSFVNINPPLLFNNDPILLWIHAPSTLEPNEEGLLLIEAWDPYERISSTYSGEIEFDIISYNVSTLSEFDRSDVEADLPSHYQFTGQIIGQGLIAPWYLPGGDNGYREFPVSISTVGIHYITLSDSYTGLTYWSNPIVVDDNGRDLFWGDVHGHSMLSDGSGMPSEAYFFAQNIAGLEFCSITDHGESLHIKNSWDALEQETNAAYAEDEFVALQGVEWTSSGGPHTPARGYGHFTCVVPGDTLPRISADIQKTPEDLWEYLDVFTADADIHALAIPHHTVRKAFIQDWTQVIETAHANEKYVRVAEAYSVHGSSLVNPYSPWSVVGSVNVPEQPVNGSSISAALRMGLRMGLIANGDGHDGFPGHSITHTGAYAGHQYPLTMDYARPSHPYPSGITGVFADELTRDSIFDALYARRTIACSDYGRPYIRFTINGVEPGDNGSTLQVSNSTSERTISLFIAQDGNPAAAFETAAKPLESGPVWSGEVQVFKNGKLWNSTPLEKEVSIMSWIDAEPITGANYTSSISKEDGDYIHEYSQDPVDVSILNTGGNDFYFIRIVFDTGRVCVIGPIWVEH
ncbi:DUF3604 domain-containing protein [Candidatus Thorarchaeota archaeon]|nr:MAG: DUF3604 domain-containing protein [Candidatus Thorarchaeota archaeon]